jgi:cell division protein ZapA
MVDREMSTIRDAGRIRARERIAVLAALNLAYQLAQAGREAPAPATDGAVPAPADPGGDAAGGNPDLQALIARLDAALQRDGHLL